MRKTIPLTTTTIALAVLVLTGCSTGALPGGGSPANDKGGHPAAAAGAGATAANACSIAHDALAKVVTGALSAPYQKADSCYFGVGPNGTESGAALSQNYSDSVLVVYKTSNGASEYQGATIAYSGSKPLNGVGTEGQYYDGGNGNPQVFADDSAAFCNVQTNFNSASEVGLTKPSGARTIAAADVPKLAADLGAVCVALFKG